MPAVKSGFRSVDEFIKYSHSIANRRKSRTGRSLEFNLEHIFLDAGLHFETHAVTEQKKQPDFLFPSARAYHDKNFNAAKLHMLAAKTCCKDRWMQIATEANRIETKHLFTLQKGISEHQIAEMTAQKVALVVPKPNIKSFPEICRRNILHLEAFIDVIKKSQSV